MIVIDNKKKIDIELTEMELILLEDSLKQTPLGVVEFYGENFHKLLNKIHRARNGRNRKNRK